MSIRIRNFRPGDEVLIAQLFKDSIRGLASQVYSALQINAWAGRARTAEAWLALASDGRQTFVAVANDSDMAGFTNLEADGHVDHLFVAPDFARQGIAARLLDHLERHARLVDMPRLFTEASAVARPVFERQGFVKLERRDFELDGVAIHNYAMEKSLAR